MVRRNFTSKLLKRLNQLQDVQSVIQIRLKKNMQNKKKSRLSYVNNEDITELRTSWIPTKLITQRVCA